MSLNDTRAKYDGFQQLGGVDSGRPTHVLDRTQLSWLVNGITRGGQVQCRPGWIKRTLSFLDQNGAVDTTLETNFKTGGRWQGGLGYEAGDGTLSLIASIGGRIFIIALASLGVQDLTGTNDPNNPNGEQAWMTQAETYLVIQNGEDKAFVFDGSALTRSVAASLGGTGIPVGKAMAYNNGRLVVARPNDHTFVVGDLAYAGTTGTAADLLQFTENQFLLGGGEFVLSAQAGPIRALCNVAIQDNTTGQGPLQIITTRAAFSLNLPFDRTTWQTTTNPIETISMLDAGAVSQDATINVNGDIWFRSPDGVRSFMIARREHGTWVNIAISNEMVRTFNLDTPALLPFASGVSFDNRWIVTSQPYVAKNSDNEVRGIAHKALGVLDFYPINSMASELSGTEEPEWQGMWTGLNILKILTVGTDNPRCFAFILNEDTEIELWELTRNGRFDSGVETNGRIEWGFESPSYGFDPSNSLGARLTNSGGYNLVQLWYGDAWFTRLAGIVDVAVQFRPDSDPVWRDWTTLQMCTPFEDCSTAECGTPAAYREQYRSRVRFPEPDATCDTILDNPVNRAYRFAVRVAVTGFCSIPQFRIVGRDQPEEVIGSCPVASCDVLGVETACEVNDLSYVIPT